MKNHAQNTSPHLLAILLVRLCMGLILMYAGYHKLFPSDPSKADATFGEIYQGWMTNYHNMSPSFVPGFIATPYGYAIPWLEMGIGLLLTLGLFFRVATVSAVFLMLSIAIAVITAKGGLSGGGGTFIHNSITMACTCLLLYFTGPGMLNADALIPKRRRR